MKMKKHFYVFRHGQTENNANNIWQGAQLNPPLNETGKKQAQELGKKLSGLRLEVIYSSNLKRAIQTAMIVNEQINVPNISDAEFCEVNFGEAEGLTYGEVETRFGELKNKITIPKQDTWHLRFPGEGSESKFEVYTRVSNEILKIAHTTEYKNIGVSAHAGVLSSLLAGLDAHGIDLPNCCIAHILYDEKINGLSFVEMI